LVDTNKDEQNEVKFIWKRSKLFDEEFVRTIYEKIIDVKIGVVKRVHFLLFRSTPNLLLGPVLYH
jgi:hypothetical protein